MTSHDVVARVRRLVGTRRVGHGGTLDPMATGVLVIGVERATRLLRYVTGTDKTYTATIRLGQTTVTDDAEGEVLTSTSAAAVTEERVRAALREFVGEIDQVPSAVSAVKVAGVRSYARVRRGEQVQLAPRRVRINRLDLLGLRRNGEVLDVDVEVDCSSGTYVRAIARDLGTSLGVGGHLAALRRTRVDGFTEEEAVTLEQLAERGGAVTVPLAQAAARCLASRQVTEEEARIVSHGGSLAEVGRPGPYAVFAPDGRVIAIMSEREGRARPEVVLSPAERGG